MMQNNRTLIIPAAKLVPEELQKIGKLPGIIYPVGQRIVFDYLYEQYHAYVNSINVICYESADKVQRRIAKYNDKSVYIQVLNELKDLGHTLYNGIGSTNGSIVINFGDTIVMNSKINLSDDSFYYAKDLQSDTWTFFDIKEGIVVNINDKVKGKEREEAKLFVGVFCFADAQLFKKCLEKAFSTIDIYISTFYYALALYSKLRKLTAIETKDWLDIGHADKYSKTNLEVKAREFNYINIDRERGILTKTSDDKDKFIGEILWYLKLPADIEYVRPRIFSYSTSYNEPYVAMEYYSYHTLHELFLYGDLTLKQWNDIFNRIRFVFNDFNRYSLSDNNIRSSVEDMYLNKTIQRLTKLKSDSMFSSFFSNSYIQINGKKYKNLELICNELKKVIPNKLFDVKEFNIIHGDLCFANILVDPNYQFIKLIDPRGRFGKYDIYGDVRYELAKLFHSIDGKYDFIIKDLFNVEFDSDDSSIIYSINDRYRDFDLYDVFFNVFKNEIGENLKKIELIQALLFLSMITLHGESINHQMVMLATGLDILNRVVDISIE